MPRSCRPIARTRTVEAAALKHRAEVMIGGMIASIKHSHTKNPKPGAPSRYAMFDLEDTEGIMRCICWPEQFAQFGELIQPEMICVLRGAIDKRAGSEEANLIVNEVIPIGDLEARYTRGIRVRVVEESHGVKKLEMLYEILRGYPGEVPLRALALPGRRAEDFLPLRHFPHRQQPRDARPRGRTAGGREFPPHYRPARRRQRAGAVIWSVGIHSYLHRLHLVYLAVRLLLKYDNASMDTCRIGGELVLRGETPMRIQQRFFSCPAALVLLMLTVWGCGKPSGQPIRVWRSAGRSKDQPTRRSQIPSDESLTADEYIHLGLPAYDREWSGDDMVKAEKVLASLAQKDYRHLPRYRSGHSGEVFARLTCLRTSTCSGIGVYLWKDDSRNRSSTSTASNQIAKLYLAGLLKNATADSESVELMGAHSRSMVVILNLVERISSLSIKKD